MIETLFSSIDWELFALVSTPIISFAAFVVYGAALFTSIKQNKIIASTSLIPYYEQEIQRFVREKKDIYFFEETLDRMIELANQPGFLKDISNGELGAGMTLESLKQKPYNFYLSFIYPLLDEESKINSFYRGLEYFAEEINKSSLIKSHKNILIRKIRRDVAVELFLFRWQLKMNRKKVPSELPAPYPNHWDSDTYFASLKLEEIEFFKRMERLEKSLTPI